MKTYEQGHPCGTLQNYVQFIIVNIFASIGDDSNLSFDSAVIIYICTWIFFSNLCCFVLMHLIIIKTPRITSSSPEVFLI